MPIQRSPQIPFGSEDLDFKEKAHESCTACASHRIIDLTTREFSQSSKEGLIIFIWDH